MTVIEALGWALGLALVGGIQALLYRVRRLEAVTMQNHDDLIKIKAKLDIE